MAECLGEYLGVGCISLYNNRPNPIAMTVFPFKSCMKISIALQQSMRSSILFLLFFFSLNAKGVSGFARATVLEVASQSLDGVGDPCDDGDPCTLMDVIQPDNTCAGFTDPNDAFTLTPSAEKVCGGDSAYFTITGPALAVVDYLLSGVSASIMLNETGRAVLGIAPLDNAETIIPDTVILALSCYQLAGTEDCNLTLSAADTLINYGGFPPYFYTKTTDIYDCYVLNFPEISYEIASPYSSITYLSTNYPVTQAYPYQSGSGFNFNFTQAGNSLYDITFQDLTNIPQHSELIVTLDSIDYGGCTVILSQESDTTIIPSHEFFLAPDLLQSMNEFETSGCYKYALSEDNCLIDIELYNYISFAYNPDLIEFGYNPNVLSDFVFEFEINGVPAVFSDFTSYNNASYNRGFNLASQVFVEELNFVFVLDDNYGVGSGPSLFLDDACGLGLTNDTIRIKPIAATGPDGCRRPFVFDYTGYFNDEFIYVLLPTEFLPSETISISCDADTVVLLGNTPANVYIWSTESFANSTQSYSWFDNIFTSSYIVNEPGDYFLLSETLDVTCQYYQKEFIVTANAGTPCDDGNPCTDDDVYDADCVCAGTYADSDGDGVCDGQEPCTEVGNACDDGDPCTLLDAIQADCSCAGFTDPNDAFTLTPSAERVCGEDSAYFTITGPALAVVNFLRNGASETITLGATGVGEVGISPPLANDLLTPDTSIIVLHSFELVGAEACYNLLGLTDTLVHFGNSRPTILNKMTWGVEDCGTQTVYDPEISYEIDVPYLSTLYYSSNYPVNFISENPYTQTDSVNNFMLYQTGDWSFASIPENSEFIFTLDSIDYGGCMVTGLGISDTTHIPSQWFALWSNYPNTHVPVENGLKKAPCIESFEVSYGMLLELYWYNIIAFPPASEDFYNWSSLEGFDFEFEIDGTVAHFNDFNSSSGGNESTVIVEGRSYLFKLDATYEGPGLYLLNEGDYDLTNDTINVKLIAATGPDGCRQSWVGDYLHFNGIYDGNGYSNEVNYLIYPTEFLPTESITISCADDSVLLLGNSIPDTSSWGEPNNADYYWSNQPINYNVPNSSWNWSQQNNVLEVNDPGSYYLLSRNGETCQLYRKEFIVTANSGTPCDDGDPCTINDVYNADCVCAGTYVDSDGDGACDSLEVAGCTDLEACNYSALATESNGTCVFPGCSDAMACNYDMSAGCDDGSCTYAGCTNQSACNYNPEAGCDDGTCFFGGCTDVQACNYNANAACEDGSCIPSGCTDEQACNYNPAAGCDNGDCQYLESFAINGNQQPVEFGESEYSYTQTTGSAYVWDAYGGIIIQPNGLSEVTVSWASQGIGQVCVQETNASGCVGISVCLDVVIQPAVSGCTNNEACNYNPEANVDDNTCLFEGDPCDDGLIQTANDSIAAWCDCVGVVGVVDLENTSYLTSYPNPASQVITILYSARSAAYAIIDVIDVQGRICSSTERHIEVGRNTIPIDVEPLVSGCYTLRINLPDVSKTIVFLKE